MKPSYRFKVILTFLLTIIVLFGIIITDLLKAGSTKKLAFLPTQFVNTSQPPEGICNRGEGSYLCLLTEEPETCPEGTHAILYRAATCAPCAAGTTDCPCVPDLYECQPISEDQFDSEPQRE